jgi:hypothetical protein
MAFWNKPDLATLLQAESRNVDIWYVLYEPHRLPAETWQRLLTRDQVTWAPFYGGAVLYLPAADTTATVMERTFAFAARQETDAVLAFERGTPSADVALTGTIQGSARLGPGNPWLSVALPPGAMRARVAYADPKDSETKLNLYRRVKPGEWNSAADFSAIYPESPQVRFPLFRSAPYLFMHHNGTVDYRVFLDKGGDFDLVFEVKDDKPGPIHLKVYFDSQKKAEFLFDRGDNRFGVQRGRVRLGKGPQRMRVIYDSFKRIKEKLKTADDEANSFEFARWKLNWVDTASAD